MLSLSLSLSDLGIRPWRWHADRWVNGRSWVRPVSHPALESSLVQDEDLRACLTVGEIAAQAPDSGVERRSKPSAVYESAARDVARSAGEFLRVEMTRERIRMTAGPYGTAPVYLAANGDVLEGSWYLPDLQSRVSVGCLLDRAVVRALARRHRYSTDTLFSDVYRLTERATATFTASGLMIHYPPAAAHVAQPQRLRADVDAVLALDELLTSAASRLKVPSDTVGVELSGGVDSANVALAVTGARGDRVSSYGLLFAGDLGTKQQQRRAELVQRLHLRDFSVHADRHLPFTPTGTRGSGLPHDPTGDVYQEAFDAVRFAASASDLRVVFTGFGGDEIMALRPVERSTPLPRVGDVPWLGDRARDALAELETNVAPVSPVPLPTLMAFAARNPLMLRRGIWPVSPLADPALVRFGESLPVSWRRRKTLLRERLRRAGFSGEVADPAQPENFSALMQAGLRRHGLPMLARMLDESLLTDAGYIDRQRLAAAYENATKSEEIPDLLYDTIALEVGLRTLAKPGRSVQ